MTNINQKSLETFFHSLNELYPSLEINSKEYQGLNIFHALHKENDEVRLHSRFLSFLLSPTSSHKKGNFFLKSFLEITGIKDFKVDTTIKVNPNEENKSEKDNIDILIKGSKQALIIENKIHAGDSITESGGQIETYINKLKAEGKKLENISIVYLTPNGHKPSKESVGKYSHKEIHLLSYKREILNWLDECIKNLSQPEDIFFKECLNQYMTLLKKLTNYINMEDQQKLLDIVSKDDNFKSAKLLYDNYENIHSITIDRFWGDLIEQLKNENFYEIGSTLDFPRDSWVHFQSKKNNKLYIMHEYNHAIYWGIEKEGLGNVDFLQQDFEFHQNFISKYFDFNDERDIILNKFSYDRTFSLINEKNRKEVIKKMVDEIKDYIDRLGL